MRRVWYYGSSFVSAQPLLLDLYPATAAYSLRKLRTGVTNVIRVRRTGDNLEADFTATEITDGTLVTWVVAGGVPQNGGVVTRYNQGTGGATYDVSQPSIADQYVIVLNGVLQIMNGLPAVDSLGYKPYLFNNELTNIQTVFNVSRITALNQINYLMGRETSPPVPSQGLFLGGTFTAVFGFGGFDGANVKSASGQTLNQSLGFWSIRNGNIYTARNGAAEVNLGAFTPPLRATHLYGRVAGLNTYGRMIDQETIIYTDDQSANKTVIDTNMKNYYGII